MTSNRKKFYRKKGFYLFLGGIIAVGVIFLFLLNQFIMPAYTNYEEGVTVPNVTRVSLTEAKNMLTASGLRYDVAERRSNEAFPADYVIDQQPTPANIVKPDRKIYLTVNVVSNPTVKVPSLKGLSLRNAKIQLQNAGLQLGSISYQSSRFKNTILDQSITANKIVNKGNEVGLVVSDGLGQEQVEIPDISGLSLANAEQILREKDLRVGEIRYQPSNKTPKTILDYTPKSKKVSRGTTIQLIVVERPSGNEP